MGRRSGRMQATSWQLSFSRPRTAKLCSRLARRPLRYEPLESRLCLSSTISGVVFHDLDNNVDPDGARDCFVGGEEPNVVMTFDGDRSAWVPSGLVGLYGQEEMVNEDWTQGVGWLARDVVWTTFTYPICVSLDPVIIASPASYNSADPAAVRVHYDPADPESFSLRLEDWGNPNGHAAETVSWLAMAPGVHRLDDGTIIEAGTVEVDSNGTWVSFEEFFQTDDLATSEVEGPIVLTQVMSMRESDTVVARASSVSRGGYRVTLQEGPDSVDGGVHVAERVGYVAIHVPDDPYNPADDNGRGYTYDGALADVHFQAMLVPGGVASSGWTPAGYDTGHVGSTPVLFAGMQTDSDADTAELRCQLNGTYELTAEEPSSAGHSLERVGFLAIESAGSCGELWAGYVEDEWHNRSHTRVADTEIVAMLALRQELIETGLGDIADVVITLMHWAPSAGRYADFDFVPSIPPSFHVTPNDDFISSHVPNTSDLVEWLLHDYEWSDGGDMQPSMHSVGLMLDYLALSVGEVAELYADPPINGGLGRIARDKDGDPVDENGNKTVDPNEFIILSAEDGNIFFMVDLDDGQHTPNQNFDAWTGAYGDGNGEREDIRELRAKVGDWAENIRSFGVGNDIELETLRSIATIDPSAAHYASLYALTQSMTTFIDTDHDGQRDYVEPGMAGVTVNLYRDDGNTVKQWDAEDTLWGTAETGGSGCYRFDDTFEDDKFEVGDTYFVVVDESTLPRYVYGTGSYARYAAIAPPPSMGSGLARVVTIQDDLQCANLGVRYAELPLQNDAITVFEDTQWVAIDVLANDCGLSSSPNPFFETLDRVCTFSRVNQPKHGTADWKDGQILYTPEENWYSSDWDSADPQDVDSLTYVVVDNFGLYFKATVEVVVMPADDRAQVPQTQLCVSMNDTLEGLLFIDVEADAVTATVEGVRHGSLVVNADGTFVYTPELGWSGVERFSVTLTQGSKSYGPTEIVIYVADGTSHGNAVTLHGISTQRRNVAVSGDTMTLGFLGTQGALDILEFDDQTLPEPSWPVRSGFNAASTTSAPSPVLTYNTQFAQSVAIQGNTTVVGHPGDTDYDWEPYGEGHISAVREIHYCGSVFVFENVLGDDGTLWAERDRLVAEDAQAEAAFGYAVAIDEDGDTIVVGAPNWDSSVPDSGKAYIYQRDQTTGYWKCVETLVPEGDPIPNQHFGYALDVNRGRIIVGTNWTYEWGLPVQEAAYVFQYDGTRSVGDQWEQTTKLVASDGCPLDHFGTSVAIDGGRALVGAYGWDEERVSTPLGENFQRGAAYFFNLASAGGPQMSETVRLYVEEAWPQDWQFGWSLDMQGNAIVIGAPAQYSGAEAKVYLVDTNDVLNVEPASPTLDCSGDVLHSGGVALGISVAVGDKWIVAAELGQTFGAIDVAHAFPRDHSPVAEDDDIVIGMAGLTTASPYEGDLSELAFDPYEGSILTISEVDDPADAVDIQSNGQFSYDFDVLEYYADYHFTYKVTDAGGVRSNLATVNIIIAIPGDANGDGTVDAKDAVRIATYWAQTTRASRRTWWEMGDFSGDERVNAVDAAILAANWGRTFAPASEEGRSSPSVSTRADIFVGPLPAGARSARIEYQGGEVVRGDGGAVVLANLVDGPDAGHSVAGLHDAAISECCSLQMGPAMFASEHYERSRMLARRRSLRRTNDRLVEHRLATGFFDV